MSTKTKDNKPLSKREARRELNRLEDRVRLAQDNQRISKKIINRLETEILQEKRELTYWIQEIRQRKKKLTLFKKAQGLITLPQRVIEGDIESNREQSRRE